MVFWLSSKSASSVKFGLLRTDSPLVILQGVGNRRRAEATTAFSNRLWSPWLMVRYHLYSAFTSHKLIELCLLGPEITLWVMQPLVFYRWGHGSMKEQRVSPASQWQKWLWTPESGLYPRALCITLLFYLKNFLKQLQYYECITVIIPCAPLTLPGFLCI